jgi:putative transposase
MARLPRLVLPGIPHHVTQRGNRREQTFFEDGDYALYLDLLRDAAAQARTEIWSYCLMPNHVHIILTPHDEDGLWRTFGDLHRRYTGYINARMRTTGHLWQGRFGSVAMDEAHLHHAVRYVALNPVRARLVARAEDWAWSSAKAHVTGIADGIVDLASVQARIPDFRSFLGEAFDEVESFAALRRSEGTGRPIGDEGWLRALEQSTGRSIVPRKPGRKGKVIGD